MALDFPSNPSNGDTWLDSSSGTEWVYNSTDKSWTMTGAGTSSPFDFRGGYDFTTANTISNLESGDLFIHEGSDGTVGSGYAGITGELITVGTLVLWDGDSFVMLSSSVPGYPDITDPNNQSGTLDDRYISALKADTAAGLITFNGGIECTAGAGNVTNGMGWQGNTSRLVLRYDAAERFSVRTDNVTVVGPGTGSQSFVCTTPVTNGSFTDVTSVESSLNLASTATITGDVSGFRSSVQMSTDVPHFAHYTTANGGLSTYAEEIIGFKAQFGGVKPSGDAADPNIGYGFYADIQNQSGIGQEAYQFYGNSTGPSFFKGSTYIGGTTARSTFGLWKSTLTEEQLEQLEAGTLVAPANVATPGDGEFARSWYYDQQDAETQALLDSGELEYPTQFAAATFTDTFIVDDTTAITLSSNGVIKAPAIQWKGSVLANNIGNRGFFFSKSNECLIGVNRPEPTLANGDVTKSVIFRVDNKDADGNYIDAQNISCIETQPPTGTQGTYQEWIGFKSQNNDSASRALSAKYGFYADISTGGGGNNYNFYASGAAPNYFKGDITCDGLINGAFSLRMQSDDPAAFDAEGSYTGTTESLLTIIQELRAENTAKQETFQELQVAVAAATDFSGLKAAMLVALEDYAV